MSDIRKLAARLYPHGASFDGGGRGGIPELTPIDIAGALGMVRNTFGRELFCALWWPDGALLVGRELDDAIRQQQLAEYLRRARLLQTARLAVMVAEESADGTHGGMPAMRRQAAQARAELGQMKEIMWPKYGERYATIRAAVLAELCDPKQCKTCGGRGHVKSGDLAAACIQCNGSGRGGANESQRAKRANISRKNFGAGNWDDVYEWTYRLCADAEQDAAAQLRERIG